MIAVGIAVGIITLNMYCVIPWNSGIREVSRMGLIAISIAIYFLIAFVIMLSIIDTDPRQGYISSGDLLRCLLWLPIIIMIISRQLVRDKEEV